CRVGLGRVAAAVVDDVVGGLRGQVAQLLRGVNDDGQEVVAPEVRVGGVGQAVEGRGGVLRAAAEGHDPVGGGPPPPGEQTAGVGQGHGAVRRRHHDLQVDVPGGGGDSNAVAVGGGERDGGARRREPLCRSSHTRLGDGADIDVPGGGGDSNAVAVGGES